MIMQSAQGFSNIIFDNFYSENLNIANAVGAFTLDHSSSIHLRLFNINIYMMF